MAYRRRQGITRISTFKEDLIYKNHNDKNENGSSDHSPNSAPASASASPSLAAQAIAARRDSTFFKPSLHRQDSAISYDYTTDEARGFWGIVARKAKSILDNDDDDDDNMSQEFRTHRRENAHMPYNSTYSTAGQFCHTYHHSPEMSRKVENPTLRNGLDALTSSLNQIGDSIGNAWEEGRSLVNKTADIIQETRKLNIRRKGNDSSKQIHISGVRNTWQEPVMYAAQAQMQSNQETQLKASRDVAMATAAKAKLLLQELKTTKADLAFAKQRCSQVEEENKILREAYEKGDHPADEDMIRLQLETLLEEKARLAHENSIYARENRFLREIVEYHQLTMQDVVYLDEDIEEVTEVYPVHALSRMRSGTPTSPRSPHTPSRISAVSRDSCASISRDGCASISRDSSASIPLQAIPNVIQDESPPTTAVQLQEITDMPKGEAPPSSRAPASTPTGSIRRLNRQV